MTYGLSLFKDGHLVVLDPEAAPGAVAHLHISGGCERLVHLRQLADRPARATEGILLHLLTALENDVDHAAALVTHVHATVSMLLGWARSHPDATWKVTPPRPQTRPPQQPPPAP